MALVEAHVHCLLGGEGYILRAMVAEFQQSKDIANKPDNQQVCPHVWKYVGMPQICINLD